MIHVVHVRSKIYSQSKIELTLVKTHLPNGITQSSLKHSLLMISTDSWTSCRYSHPNYRNFGTLSSFPFWSLSASSSKSSSSLPEIEESTQKTNGWPLLFGSLTCQLTPSPPLLLAFSLRPEAVRKLPPIPRLQSLCCGLLSF